jgi:hypothetical protein
MTIIRTYRLAAALATTALLAACSSGSDGPRVADVPSSGSPSATSSGAPAQGSPAASGGAADESGPVEGRPQLRLDDTDQRRTALQSAYSQCLIDHGARELKPGEGDRGAMSAAAGEGSDGKPVGPFVVDPVPASASAACLSRLPVMPVELEARSNPRFHEQSLAYVKCLEDGGLYVTLLDDENLDWTYQEGHSVPEDSHRLEDDCLLTAFKR